MTDLQKQAAEVVGRLTKAQREVLVWPSRIHDWREEYAYRMHDGARSVNAARELYALGLLERKDTRKWYRLDKTAAFNVFYRLTPLGLAVRQLLQDNPHARDNEEMSDGL